MSYLQRLFALAVLVGTGAAAEPGQTDVTKGQPASPARTEHLSLLFSFGMGVGPVDPLVALPSAHIAVHFGSVEGFSIMATTTNIPLISNVGPHPGFSFLVSAGYRWGFKTGPWRFYLGPEAGFGGLLWEAEKGASMLTVGPYFGTSVQAHPRVLLTLEGHVPFVFGIKSSRWDIDCASSTSDCATINLVQPAAWLGFSIVL